MKKYKLLIEDLTNYPIDKVRLERLGYTARKNLSLNIQIGAIKAFNLDLPP